MRLGILGTMVWDRIDLPDAPRVERWGGIAYSLAAAGAALPVGWAARPIVKLGRDLAPRALDFMETLPGLELPGGVVETPEPNNRVHLRYADRHHRQERLTGGVPGWRWEELEPHLEGLDGLYANLISGFELDLETAQRLRKAFQGPLYADFHSLLLGVAEGGQRVPRALDRRDDWLDSFDVVQVNETELALVAGADDPWQVARGAVRDGLPALLVTRGPEGATALVAADGPRPWDAAPAEGREPRLLDIPVAEEWPVGDPTGCGDVWGATCFVALMRGAPLSGAMAEANRAASRNVGHRGADGLYHYLKGAA